MGVLLYIIVVDQVFLIPQFPRRTGTKKVNFQKRTLHKQTIEMKQIKQKATFTQLQFIPDGGTPSIDPGFQRSLSSSTRVTASFTHPSAK